MAYWSSTWALEPGAQPLAGFVSFEKLFYLSGLQGSHLKNKNNSTYLTELLQRLNEIQVKQSRQGPLKQLVVK